LSHEEQRALEALAGPGVREVVEPSRRLIILPKVTLPPGSQPAEAFAIYHASAHGGYSTRLFFEVPIRGASGVTPQTVTDSLCGRTMYAASYNGVPADLPPHQGILAHLRLYEATL
jgi:hypothetical protein